MLIHVRRAQVTYEFIGELICDEGERERQGKGMKDSVFIESICTCIGIGFAICICIDLYLY